MGGSTVRLARGGVPPCPDTTLSVHRRPEQQPHVRLIRRAHENVRVVPLADHGVSPRRDDRTSTLTVRAATSA